MRIYDSTIWRSAVLLKLAWHFIRGSHFVRFIYLTFLLLFHRCVFFLFIFLLPCSLERKDKSLCVCVCVCWMLCSTKRFLIKTTITLNSHCFIFTSLQIQLTILHLCYVCASVEVLSGRGGRARQKNADDDDKNGNKSREGLRLSG